MSLKSVVDDVVSECTLTKLAINYAQDGAMNVMCDIRVIQYM